MSTEGGLTSQGLLHFDHTVVLTCTFLLSGQPVCMILYTLCNVNAIISLLYHISVHISIQHVDNQGIVPQLESYMYGKILGMFPQEFMRF